MHFRALSLAFLSIRLSLGFLTTVAWLPCRKGLLPCQTKETSLRGLKARWGSAAATAAGLLRKKDLPKSGMVRFPTSRGAEKSWELEKRERRGVKNKVAPDTISTWHSFTKRETVVHFFWAVWASERASVITLANMRKQMMQHMSLVSCVSNSLLSVRFFLFEQPYSLRLILLWAILFWMINWEMFRNNGYC